jgi:hypothetical protein
MANSDELIGTVEYLKPQTNCRINRCRYNRVRLNFFFQKTPPCMEFKGLISLYINYSTRWRGGGRPRWTNG